MMHARIPSAATRIVTIACLAATLTSSADEPPAPALPLKDVPYKTGDTLTPYEKERCRLDIALPDAAAATPAPVLVFFHGGSLAAGDKHGARLLASLASRHGILTVAPNYRLSPAVQYPEYISDAAAAVAWVKHNIPRYGGDTGKLFLSGHSAGGYLAMMCALDTNVLATAGLSPSDIAGLIPISGQMVTHSTVRAERGIPRSVMVVDSASPLHHARPTPSAFLLVCGGNDMPARLEENLLMASWLRAAGNTNVATLCVPGRTHESIYNQLSQPHDEVATAILDFILRPSRPAIP